MNTSYIYIKHHHGLKYGACRERVEKIAQYLKKKYKTNYSWKGNRLLSRHMGCVVSVYLEDEQLELRMKLGILFSPMKGKIEKALRKNLLSVIGDKKGAPVKVVLHEDL